MNGRLLPKWILAGTFFFILVTSGLAETFEVLSSLPVNGWAYSEPIQGQDGALYGTTGYGGSDDNCGTIYKMTLSGQLTVLYVFYRTNSSYPMAALTQLKDGSFYGTTSGGDGTVFRFESNGVFTTLFKFGYTNGAIPECKLVQGTNGNLYGITTYGGRYRDAYGNTFGTAFMITPEGKLTTLLSFDGLHGACPFAGLLLAKEGYFYGTTGQGGISQNSYFGNGTIFRLSHKGELTTLATFQGKDGSDPRSPLIEAADGCFYGTTRYGGSYNLGTVYKMTRDGKIVTVVSFDGSNGRLPWGSGLVQTADGTLYGTTYEGGTFFPGTVFSVNTTGLLRTIVNFDGHNGGGPRAGLIEANDGNLYGTCMSPPEVFRIRLEPRLQISNTDSGSTVSWPTNALGFSLEASTNLTNWAKVSSGSLENNAKVTFTNGYSEKMRFFRLIKN